MNSGTCNERRTSGMHLLGILAWTLGVVLATGTSAFAWCCTPPQPTECSSATFDATNLSVVTIDLNYADPGPWPNGCLQTLRAVPGTTLQITVKNANKNKYRVEIAGKAEKTTKEPVPGAIKAILPGVDEPPKPVETTSAPTKASLVSGQPFMAESSSSKSDLESFDEAIAKLSKISETIEAAAAEKETAKDYDELTLKEREGLKGLEELKDCANGAVPCAKALERVPGTIDVYVNNAARHFGKIRTALTDDKVGTKYILDLAEKKFDAALKQQREAPELVARLSTHQDPDQKDAVIAALFTTSRSVDFTGDPLTIDVKVESGPKDAPVTAYKMQVRVQPKRVAAYTFSTGFFFSGLVDRSYSILDGKIDRRGSEDAVKPAIGVLAHWHPTRDCWAFSAGVAGKDSELQYLLGLSWLSGKTQRFVLTAGTAIGSVKRLDGVEEGDALSSTTVPTRDVSRVSWLAGVSFRF